MSTDKAGESTVIHDKEQTTTTDLEKQQHIAADAERSPSSNESVDQPQEAPKPPTNPWADPSSFPDGGPQAWMTVAAASACFFVSWGWINCIGVFQDYFMRGGHDLSATLTIADCL